MLVLAIDTATPAVTAGLVELPGAGGGPPRLLGERVTLDARAHAERLAPQVSELLAAAAAARPAAGRRAPAQPAPAQPDAVVCGDGPGPFTGLRVGLVTAAALGDGWGVPVYGVCSLDAIAVAAGWSPQARPGTTDQLLLVATDARRREVYWAAYRGGARVDGPHVERPAELAGRLPGLGAVVAAGAGAALYAGVLGLPVLDTPYPTALGLVTVAAAELRAGRPPRPLVPRYLRRPDAAEPGPRKLATARPVDKS